ncbi:MAG: type II secretion system F family protein [Vibrio sp.]
MPTYQYQGRNAQGNKVNGQVDAPTEELAAESLFSQGVIPISITQSKDKASRDFDLSEWLVRAIPLEVLVIFCRQLYSLTKAGVPLLRAMKGLIQNSTNKQLTKALESVTSELTNGRSFSSSLQQHPDVFSPLFVSMINVGENTGRLDEALMQLSHYYEKELETRKRIKEVMRYPILVIAFIAIAITALNLWVIPKFATMFSRFGVDLPLPTQFLIATSNFFVNYWVLLIAIVFAMLFGFKAWISRAAGREKWDHYRLRMPIVGSIVNRAQMARFSRTFSLMLRAGVPINQSLSLAAEALGNRYLEVRLLEMKSSIEAGSYISTTAINSNIFTPLVIQMLAVGEETGRIDELLLEVADFYEREVDYDLKTLTARIEPILLVIVAVMVLILALGIFLPMWNLLDVVKGR